MKKLTASVICGLVLGASAPLSAGWNFNALKDIELVKVQYFNYTTFEGMPVYGRGDTVMFRVSIHNFGNRPFKNFPVSTSLHWADTAVCDGIVYPAGDPLPGGSRSPIQVIAMKGQDVGYFDVSYQIPNDACPNTVEVRLDGGKGGKPDSEPLHLRDRFRFE
jgi:hypothetical protein